ncbi:hypothetical protein [uncultured Bacteroides sp.]|uniref:hypothetical protein n=1 Tax=uncultured Bacteroides sp. TaxID=162156 RepID=UPI002631673E|nr:hypothetical protein [uncultured Bacteroides sp.]
MKSDTSHGFWYRIFHRNPPDDMILLGKRFERFGLTDMEMKEALQSACSFFDIPSAQIIKKLTHTPKGQTMFLDWDRKHHADDTLCYNMQQLIDMKVEKKDAFALVVTHECAHEFMQRKHFEGIGLGAWDTELASDFLLSCWAGLTKIDIFKVNMGLLTTCGSRLHPDGVLRSLFVRYGYYRVIELKEQDLPILIPGLMNEFVAFKQLHIQQIITLHRKYEHS